MILKKYTFNSERKGKNVLFLGAIHGNEQAGTKAIYMVLEKFASKALTPLNGSVSFIPVCNPQAFADNVCQDDELIKHFSQADVILSFHTTSSVLDKPVALVKNNNDLANKILSALNVKYVILDNSLQNHYKCLIDIKCGQHDSDKSVENAYYTIMSTLLCLDMLQGYPAQPIKQEYITLDSIVFKTKDGKLAKDFKNFTKVSSGEILAIYDDKTFEICPKDSYILLPRPDAKIKEEWFYLGSKTDNY
ncbi:MAG: succinylglutamate desuccinylase/aspartoacylase family protein [Alphaproteobacteria bacterium]|nr:succinylglutamate desuccinylase/aspartoacylase family protein [Alphaproteobacteria bacterium]